jgi:hypothetical protein
MHMTNETLALQTYNTPNHYCCMHLNCIRTCSNSGQTLQEMSVKMRTEDLNACTQACAHEWNSRTAKCEGEGDVAMGGALGMWRKEGEAEDRRGKGGGRGNRGPGRVAWGVAW